MASTFICYRGNSIDGGIGKRIGKQIYNIIKDDPFFGEVFFSPEWPDNDFIVDACNFIAKADNFFVILSPSFFRDFEINGQMNPESVTYHEIKAAFENANCTFRPIFVYGFEWNSNDALAQLRRFFPNNDVTRLYHRTGLVLSGDTITPQQVQRFRSATDIWNDITLKKESLLKDLDNCVNTIFDTKIPLDPQSMLSDIFEYLHMNPHRKLLFPNAFRQEFDRVSAECKLPSAQFCYWPVDLLNYDTSQQPSISICAICFGTLVLHHWLTIDQHRSHPVDAETLQEIRQAIDGAINLLVALRSPINGSWPASWNFDSTGIDGTINQTTLSLSTLLSCGFLSADLDPEIFEKRYYYIVKSVDWLLSAANTTRQHFQLLMGWGHMRENNDIATLPTTFAIDTLIKFRSCLQTWMSAFPEDSPLYKELSNKHTEVQTSLCQCVRYFHHVFSDNGIGFCISEEDGNISITHTAKVLKTLIRFLDTSKRTDVPQNLLAATEEIVEKIKFFLAGVKTDRLFRLTSTEIFESFLYTNLPSNTSLPNFNPNSGETFEMCGELIYLDALAGYAISGKGCTDAEFLHIAEVFQQFREQNISTQSGRFLVSGHKPDFPKYPIYAMYYYRMVLDDLLGLGEEYGE